jgi:hypothetical protein
LIVGAVIDAPGCGIELLPRHRESAFEMQILVALHRCVVKMSELILLVNFLSGACGSVVCMSPRPGQRRVFVNRRAPERTQG